MKKALLTGSSGFIGSNIKNILEKEFILYSPLRNELDLKDSGAVRRYICDNSIDIIFHCANPNPVKNPIDKSGTMTEDSIRIFLNFPPLFLLVILANILLPVYLLALL